MAAVVSAAFRTAATGRPGPVLIEIPEDVAEELVVANAGSPIPPAVPHPNPQAIRDAAALLDSAERPIFLVSEHANRTTESAALTRCVEALGVGVVMTQLGLGALDEDHELAIGSMGINRPDYIHNVVFDADLVIAVGVTTRQNIRHCRGTDTTTSRSFMFYRGQLR